MFFLLLKLKTNCDGFIDLICSLPSQSKGQVGEGGNHTARSFGRGTGGSSCPHKKDSAEPPSEERVTQVVMTGSPGAAERLEPSGCSLAAEQNLSGGFISQLLSQTH